MRHLHFFSSHYGQARQRFRDAVQALNWRLLSYPISAQGPDGELLTIDVAINELPDADSALVLSSGIHGVEGFVGSAIQLALLDRWITEPMSRPPARVVIIHALNPYGFAWKRRVNEDNIDINRNLLLSGEPYRGSDPIYPKLDPLLNPKCPPSWWDPVWLKFGLAAARFGPTALKQAVASGQYDYPQGLFFGGAGPTQTHSILESHVGEWLGHCQRIVHLDFHTGLGQWANCRLLIDYALQDHQIRWMNQWFGHNSFEATHPQNISYELRGSFGRWCVARSPQREYLYATAEFGTYRPPLMLRALREENQAHHWCRPKDAAVQTARKRLLEMFCPYSQGWRDRVVRHSCRLTEQAISGLASERSNQKSYKQAI